MGRRTNWSVTQEGIVFLTAIVLFAFFAIFARGFLDIGNLIALVRSVSTLGVLALAMAMIVIGRGIDLSMVGSMVIASAYFIVLYSSGHSLALALLGGLALALVVGAVQGALIAFADAPPFFTTLAMGVTIYGFGQFLLIDQDVERLPPTDTSFLPLGAMRVFGLPVQILALVIVALIVHLMLRYTKHGNFTYALGDNPSAAWLVGIPTRSVVMTGYLLSASLAYLAGLMTVSSVASMSLRVFNSTLIYDVILVVVLGGIKLGGGQGQVRNVLAGTALVGVLLNGMTLMDMSYTAQNVIKGTILLFALMLDTYLNPRDEQIDKQGDI